MVAKLIAGKLLKLAAKGIVSEKLKIRIVCGLGDMLVKSTKNELDDKVWKKVKSLLLTKI
tara:strand:- start:16061 stop:16240 length:180 start_codon:yes stop_codon:yes gene_type:complete